MEKKLLNLSDLVYQSMLLQIVVAVRKQAKTIPVFRDSRNGCIRITIVPLSPEADKWLGGFLYHECTEYDAENPDGLDVIDVGKRDFTFKIDPKGSYTVQYVCEDGHTEPVNCYGYSALKTAYASWQRKFDAEVRDKDLGETFADFQYRQHTQFFTEENGWSMEDGAVYTTVSLNGEDFIRLYVCTSGAKSSEDRECSLAGILKAQQFFRRYYAGIVRFNPYIDGEKSPLEQIWRD